MWNQLLLSGRNASGGFLVMRAYVYQLIYISVKTHVASGPVSLPGCEQARYLTVERPSAQENSRSSSFGGDAFRYVRICVKGSSNAFGSVEVIRSSRMPGSLNLMRSCTVS